MGHYKSRNSCHSYSPLVEVCRKAYLVCLVFITSVPLKASLHGHSSNGRKCQRHNRKHGVASSLSRFSQVFFLSWETPAYTRILHLVRLWWYICGWFKVWNDVTVPVRTCWSWCRIKENHLQNDCQLNPVQGNIIVCMHMYHLNIDVAACIPITVCKKGGGGPSHNGTVSFQENPCGGEKCLLASTSTYSYAWDCQGGCPVLTAFMLDSIPYSWPQEHSQTGVTPASLAPVHSGTLYY